MISFGETYMTQGVSLTEKHIFPGGAIAFPVNTGENDVAAGKNFHVPLSMRTKTPFTVRTLWGRWFDGAPLEPSPIGVAKLIVLFYAKQTSDQRVVYLGTHNLSITFSNIAQQMEDHYVDMDITSWMSTDYESLALIFHRLTGREGDTLDFPVGLMLGRVLP